jgi:hypothetical protein
VQRKLQEGTTLQWLNPLASDINELALQSANTQFSNSLFFNRNAKVFSAEYSWLQQENKMLLASGYDARSQTKNQLNLRLNINSKLAIETTLLQGHNAALADYTSGRNFQITQQELKPQVIYQDGSQLRPSLIGSLGTKTNSALYGGETAKSKALETTWKINRSEKGSLNGSLKYVYFDFDGTALSAVGYEMLEGLRPGTNWTWNLSFQKIIGKNLQIISPEILDKNLEVLNEMIKNKSFKNLKAWQTNFTVQKYNYKELIEYVNWQLSYDQLSIIFFNYIAQWGHLDDTTYNTLNIDSDDKILLKDILSDDIFNNKKVMLGNLNLFK